MPTLLRVARIINPFLMSRSPLKQFDFVPDFRVVVQADVGILHL
jgi:hypothetical protein